MGLRAPTETEGKEMSMPQNELTLAKIKARRPSLDGQVSVDEVDWLIKTLETQGQSCAEQSARIRDLLEAGLVADYANSRVLAAVANRLAAMAKGELR